MSLTDDDWVLHLDEETIIDDHVVGACLEFIQFGDPTLDYANVCFCQMMKELSCHRSQILTWKGTHPLQFSLLLEKHVHNLRRCRQGKGRHLWEILPHL